MSFTTDIVIGLEVHIELDTETKLFSSCPTKGHDQPNNRTDVVSLGMPGSKPVLNKKALEYALKLCLACNCDIAPELVFSRKSYFYPDLSKNYQITQFELPLGNKGKIKISDKEINLKRIHIEEDPASLVHPSGSMHDASYVLIDYNRSGNPLVELVTEPELTSPEEARDFMKRLITLLSYLEIFDIQEGIIKADANISIKESNYSRVEVKNITGFKDIERALKYELDRQKKNAASGKPITQETRSWDTQQGITRSMRSKETEEEYGYIIDPDLVPIDITTEMIEETKKTLPKLADERIDYYITHHKIAPIDAEVLAASKELADMFEAVSEKADPALAAKWIRRELVRVLNYNKKELSETNITPSHLITLFNLVAEKKITETTGQKLMEKLIEEAFDVADHVKKEGLEAVSNAEELEKFCKEAIEECPQAIDDFKKGSDKALNFVVGKVMQKTKGKASPKEVNEIMRKLLQDKS